MNTETIERVTDSAPESILMLLRTAYSWAAELADRAPGTVLEVGGGDLRLGRELFGATDVDIDPDLENDYVADATELPFPDNAYRDTICFETIEHSERPLNVLSELVRVTSETVWLCSVNSEGPNFLHDDIAIWKGASNPFHPSEMNTDQWQKLMSGLDVEFFSVMLLADASGESPYVMVRGAHPGAYVNAARISIRRP